jgi:MscS family membrane protein
MSRLASILLTVLVSLAAAATARAAIPGVPQPSQSVEASQAPAVDPLGRSTPSGTVMGFMKAVQREDYERAVDYLDTRQPPTQAQQLARQLQLVLNRGFSGALPTPSNINEGTPTPGLRSDQERIGVVKINSVTCEILLQRVQRGNDPPIWLFSSVTLKQIPKLHQEFEYFWVERHLPRVLLEIKVFSHPLWRVLLLILLIPLSFTLAWLLSRALILLLRLLVTQVMKKQGPVARMKGPIWVLALALVSYGGSFIAYSLLMRLFWVYVAATLTVLGATWLCVRVIEVVVSIIEARPHFVVSSGRIAMTRIISKLAKAMAVIIGAFVIFYMAGINLTAVLTGLGVGGIAIAFAAQKTLENLFGGIMIISDQPIRVGDYCRAGEYEGTVEDIGLRSTRIRTLARTVVSVPNGQLATMGLDNFTLRDKFWFHHNANLRYETTADQLRQVIANLRKMLLDHPRVERRTVRVRLVGLKDWSIAIDLFAYVIVPSWETYLEIQEELLLRIMELVEASGTSFAFPSQTIYHPAQVPGLDPPGGQEVLKKM